MEGKCLRQTKNRIFEVRKLREVRISNSVWGGGGSVYS